MTYKNFYQGKAQPVGKTRILKGSRVAETDRACIASGVDSKWLMGNAGRSVSAAVIKDHDQGVIKGKNGMIVCGGGNNGGDGFVAAIDLIGSGFDMDVFFTCLPERFSKDSSFYFNQLIKISPEGTRYLDFSNDTIKQEFLNRASDSSFIIDAVFGTGLHGKAIRDQSAEIIESVNKVRATKKELKIYSVDIPSGIDSDNGEILGVAIKADKTITFGCKKLGIALYPGREFAGEIVVADIGIENKFFEDLEEIYEADIEWVASRIPKRQSWTYKHKVGKLLVIAGSIGYSGAATMTCEAALRTGAGIVTLVCPWEMNSIFEVKLTEVMTYPVEQTDDVTLHLDAFEEISQLSEGFDAIAIGPGLSRNPSTICLVREILKNIKRPTVLDADGLRALYGPMEIEESNNNLDLSHIVITPHPGELASVLGREKIDLSGRLASNEEVAKKYKLISVLKGASTLITDPDRRTFINMTGDWALATAGTGDILTGIIGSLLSQGMTLWDGAICGTFIHGLASDIISKKTSRTSMIATDLLEGIGAVFREIERIKY